jgi:uncharacterized protein with NAD-binding domain and iron-sulfur cluster
VVVGGGWAGFGAASNLSKAGWKVSVLDASPAPGGVAGGKAGGEIELGIKGCWYHYKNIEKVLEEIGLPVHQAYGDFAETAFYSERGLEVVSPVFSKCSPRLPAPLGPLAYTSDRFTDLPIGDRLTALPLLQALLEFDLDEETYEAYDSISFEELCRKAKISQRLYDQFLKPILLALLFVPPRELSAAAGLSVLSNYVLQHQSDFDVRWPKIPPSKIFLRWRKSLEERYGTAFRNSTPVKRVLHDEKSVLGVETGTGEKIEAQVVILATGAFALPKIVAASNLDRCKGLSRCQELSKCSAVTAVRFAIDGNIPLKYSSNVFSEEKRNIAGTFYDIGALRGEAAGHIFEVDTYNAAGLLGLDDLELEAAAKNVLSLQDPKFKSVKVDRNTLQVVKAKNAAFRWTPGSHGATPAITPAGAPRGLLIAGDLVKNGPNEFDAHLGARGLSQEKALVTGLQAAILANQDFDNDDDFDVSSLKRSIPVEPDEAHIQGLKESLRFARSSGLVPLLAQK